ncbi:hypothetical protein PIB30_114614, partial [Stylosanthes scabra]|nr:hypothetical protein [Stylosanthes scabra]
IINVGPTPPLPHGAAPSTLRRRPLSEAAADPVGSRSDPLLQPPPDPFLPLPIRLPSLRRGSDLIGLFSAVVRSIFFLRRLAQQGTWS